MKKESWVEIGGIFSAIAASFCCIGPAIAIGLGLGSATFFSILEPFRPIFLGVTVLLMSYGYYLLYHKKKKCPPGEVCEVDSKLKNQRKLFWVLVAVIVAILSFPLWVGILYA